MARIPTGVTILDGCPFAGTVSTVRREGVRVDRGRDVTGVVAGTVGEDGMRALRGVDALSCGGAFTRS